MCLTPPQNWFDTSPRQRRGPVFNRHRGRLQPAFDGLFPKRKNVLTGAESGKDAVLQVEQVAKRIVH
jgi:hypothetical protein